MSNKDSHYKLDFKIKTDDGRSLTLQRFRRRYWYAADNYTNIPELSYITSLYKKEALFSQLVPKTKEQLEECELALGLTLHDEHKSLILQFGASGENDFWVFMEKNGRHNYGASEALERITSYMASKTKLFQEYEAKFKEWLKKRPGVVEAWKTKYGTEIGSVLEFARNSYGTDFRTVLENSRPRKLKIGTLVELKGEYKDKRGKDPFYYSDAETRKAPRLGMIAKFDETSNAYGHGSRQLKIMWIANSSETYIMERCLKILSE